MFPVCQYWRRFPKAWKLMWCRYTDPSRSNCFQRRGCEFNRSLVQFHYIPLSTTLIFISLMLIYRYLSTFPILTMYQHFYKAPNKFPLVTAISCLRNLNIVNRYQDRKLQVSKICSLFILTSMLRFYYYLSSFIWNFVKENTK